MMILSRVTRKATIFMALALSATAALAQSEENICETFPTLAKKVAQQQYEAAFDQFVTLKKSFCFNNDQLENNAAISVVIPWGNALFAEIFQGEKITFDRAQTERLLEKEAAIAKVIKESNVDGMRNWRFNFLNLVLQLSDKSERENVFLSETAFRMINDVIAGYVREKKDEKLAQFPKDFDQYQFDGFVQYLAENQNLLVDTTQFGAPRTVGGVDALTALYNDRISQLSSTREMTFSSSEKQDSAFYVMQSPIRFHYDSTALTEEGNDAFNRSLEVFRSNTTHSILIIGHTDTKGSDEYNCWLSQCRAENVKRRLIDAGIAANKLTVAYVGERVPLTDNQDPEFMRTILVQPSKDAARRRVQFEVGGQLLLDRYRAEGKLCQILPQYAQKPCPN